MNNVRRKELQAIVNTLEEKRETLEVLKEEEEEYRDNMPENLHGSERYDISSEAISDLELALDSIDSAISYIEAAIGE